MASDPNAPATFLRAFARITPAKLLLTVVIGLAPAFVLRIVCKDGPECSYCLSLNFQQFFPLIRNTCGRNTRAVAVLERLSRPVNRILDIAHAYLLACLLLLPWEVRRARVDGSAAYLPGAVAFAALVAAYATQQAWLRAGVPIVCRSERFQLDAATLAYDTAGLAVDIWLLVTVLAAERRAGPWSALRRTLAVLVVVAQTTGMLYRYTGLTAAPEDSFALLLGAAYVVSPVNLLLALVTVYHTRETT